MSAFNVDSRSRVSFDACLFEPSYGFNASVRLDMLPMVPPLVDELDREPSWSI